MALSQPVRRSRRGLGVPLSSLTGDVSTITTGEAVYTRPTEPAKDLERDQFGELERTELDVDSLETRFYRSFSAATEPVASNGGVKRAKKVYGKKQAPVLGDLSVGDTVLVNAMSGNKPSVGVLVAIWKVYDGEEAKWTNVRIHWFSRESELPAHRSERDILQNEVFYQLSETSIVSPSVVLGRCTVLAQSTPDWSPDDNTFVCVNAIHARRNLYYEFNWDAFRTSALSLISTSAPSSSTQPISSDIWEQTEHWDVIPGETPFTPKKPRNRAYKRSRGALGAIAEESEDEAPEDSPSKRKRAHDTPDARRKRAREDSEDEEPGAAEDELPSILPETPVKRGPGRPRGRGLKSTSTRHKAEAPIPSSSEDEDDRSEDYAQPIAPEDDDDEEEEEQDIPESEQEPDTPSEDDYASDLEPRTPRKRKTRDGAASTPRRRRGSTLAAPTPHTKAAIRARTKKQRLAVRPPPGPGIADEFELSSVPPDAWLRAMHVLHVAARPTAQLSCREGEYARVLGAVEELLLEGAGGCVYISGVPGTGKTATVHAVVRALKCMAGAGAAEPFAYVEVNGLRVPEPQAAYGLLWEAVSGHDAVREGHMKVSPREALRNLSRHFAGGSGPRRHACVVLMDELDQLMTTKQDVVYNFFNWPTLVGSKLIVLAVANTMDLPERVMSGRVRSRLGMVRINFQPYTTPQLEQIVRARLASAKADLPEDTPDVIAPDGIKFAAMKVSSISGDARRVLDICRRAVELVEPARRTARTDDIKRVIQDMQNSPTAAYLRELPFHERLLLAALLRVVKREGVEEVRWGDVRHQHALHVPVLADDAAATHRPSREELAMVLDSLAASRAVLCEDGPLAVRKHEDDRRVVLNLEFGEVERVLGEVGGMRWRNALNV